MSLNLFILSESVLLILRKAFFVCNTSTFFYLKKNEVVLLASGEPEDGTKKLSTKEKGYT
ncbi:hypothetical protein [Pedobacter sp.]|uniref:hypothetical protein n=1 Tax=Pedobacter sp. TaxID=1411316 RepID=UPI0031DA45B1